MTTGVRVRFAPSPTGFLHIGNVRTALFNYLFAKRGRGTFILRIDDTDLERCKPEYRDAILEDLLWMGIRWDEGPGVNGPYSPYEQSKRLEVYQQHIEQLLQKEKAYYCYVTEAELQEMKRLASAQKRSPRFDNRGRYFLREEIESRRARGIKPVVRFKIENPEMKVEDLVRGEVSFNLDEMLGDFVIQRADGMPTFHLASCVDDGLMKITHVIRGEDHLSNTPKHILLLKALGFTPPQYGHLSLVHGADGGPLSKRLESVSVKNFRRIGIRAPALANYIALLGWSPENNREIFSWKELQEAFHLAQVNKSASHFDAKKLEWINGEHLRAMSDEDFTREAMAYLKGHNQLKYDEQLTRRTLPIYKDNVVRFDELPDRLEILSEDFSYEDHGLIQTPEAKEVFRTALGILSTLEGPGEALYDAFVVALKAKSKAKGKSLLRPIRMALTGREHGPELKRIFSVLGREHVKNRLEHALKQ